jgi:CPA2 family monovalent cation:H+ antiporter-2
MPDLDILRDLILTYALALGLVVALARLGVPSIVSMILAGIVSGPDALGIVETREQVEVLAQVGIALLLFTVGLEFSTSQLRHTWRTIAGGGFLQMALTSIAAGGLARAFGASPQLAALVGFFVAMSSTALVLKELSERNEVATPHGRLIVGVLLFQDLCVIFLLLLVPILSGQTSIAAVPLALGRAAVALFVVAVGGRLVLPRLLALVVASRRREAFPLAIMLASIGTAWISTQLGLPMALGAFLGGLMLSESEFSHQAYAEIRPLRDILSSLFFVSIGMLIDPGFLAGSLPSVLGTAGLIILLKCALAVAACRVASGSLRVAVAAGVALSQVGEFSFIIGQLGVATGLVSPEVWQLLLAASILTMTVTPALLKVGPRLSTWLADRSHAATPAGLDTATEPLTHHVIILGFGVGGRMVAHSLREVGRHYVILELNGATVRQARADGEPIFYADATHPDTLRAAEIDRAAAVVLVLSDPDATARVLRTIRAGWPHVPVITRTRYRLEAQRMEALGATVAVAEELEGSLEVLAHVLLRADVPRQIVGHILDQHRQALSMLQAMDTAPHVTST